MCFGVCQLRQRWLRLDILGSGCAFLNVGVSLQTCRNDDVTLNFAVPAGELGELREDAAQLHPTGEEKSHFHTSTASCMSAQLADYLSLIINALFPLSVVMLLVSKDAAAAALRPAANVCQVTPSADLEQSRKKTQRLSNTHKNCMHRDDLCELSCRKFKTFTHLIKYYNVAK